MFSSNLLLLVFDCGDRDALRAGKLGLLSKHGIKTHQHRRGYGLMSCPQIKTHKALLANGAWFRLDWVIEMWLKSQASVSESDSLSQLGLLLIAHNSANFVRDALYVSKQIKSKQIILNALHFSFSFTLFCFLFYTLHHQFTQWIVMIVQFSCSLYFVS